MPVAGVNTCAARRHAPTPIAEKVVSHGGWTGLDQATIHAVRDGAQPGDPLPPLQPRPYIVGVTDTEVTITGRGPGRRVAVLFSHEDFPSANPTHRAEPGRCLLCPRMARQETRTP